MPRNPRLVSVAATASALGVLAACSLFEFSPYQVPSRGEDSVDESPSGTSAHVGRLEALAKRAALPFSFAVLADTHSDYDDLADAVARLNADTDIDFVIVAGDLTQYGLLREFEWFRDIMNRLEKPYVTVPGNHDALANGETVYRLVFGPLDYDFTFGGVRFVCANTNAWEFTANVPDWTGLEAGLAAAGDSLRLFTVSHVPPFGDQMAGPDADRWVALMARHRVELSIHGHQHNHRFEETYGDGVRYLVADNVGDRNFARVTVADTGVAVERVVF